MHPNTALYEQDCSTWTQTTAALIRAGQWQDLTPPRDRAWTAPVTVISTLACLLCAKPTVSLDVISLVASSCGYYRGQIEQRVAH